MLATLRAARHTAAMRRRRPISFLEPQSTSTTPSPRGAPDDGDAPLVDGLRDRLEPWQPFETGWVDAADIVLVADYRMGSYPCIFRPGGTIDMPLARTFEVVEVLKGRLATDAFDFALPIPSAASGGPSMRFPSELAETRRYLVFLAPGPKARAMLDDPSHMYTLDAHVGASDLVAIVDLDATKAEVEARAREVARWKDGEAFSLDAATWRSLQAQDSVATDTQRRVLHTLREELVPVWATRADVEAVLGKPDALAGQDDLGHDVELHFVNARQRANATGDGAFAARIELTYDARGMIRAYRDDWDIIEDGAVRDASYEEKKAAELDWVHVERR